MNQNKSFRQPFSKGCGFQRQSLWSHVATCETPLRWKRQVALKLSAKFYFCFARLEVALCATSLACAWLLQEKSPLANFRFAQPRKISQWEIFLLQVHKLRKRKTAQRLFSGPPGEQRSAFPAFCLPRGNSAAHSPAPHLPLQAPKRSSLPTGRLLLFRISRLF